MPGDLVIDGAQSPEGAGGDTNVVAYFFGANGNIDVELSDGTVYTRGELTLQQFRNLQALQTSDGINFTNLAAAMPVFSIAVPNASGLGAIAWGGVGNPAIVSCA